MPRIHFITYFFGLSVAIGLLQTFAIRLALYYELPWLDVVMHTLGGIWVASIAFIVFQSFQNLREVYHFRFLFITTLSAFIVAVSWERLELLFGLNKIPPGLYWPDALLDVGLGTLGAFVAAYFFSKQFRIV